MRWQESGNRGSMPSRKSPSAGTFQVIRKTFAAVSRSSRKPGRTSCARGPCTGSSSASQQTEQHDNARHGAAAGGFWHDDSVAGEEGLILCRLRRGATLGEPLALHRRPHLLEWRQFRRFDGRHQDQVQAHRPIAADRPSVPRADCAIACAKLSPNSAAIRSSGVRLKRSPNSNGSPSFAAPGAALTSRARICLASASAVAPRLWLTKTCRNEISGWVRNFSAMGLEIGAQLGLLRRRHRVLEQRTPSSGATGGG